MSKRKTQFLVTSLAFVAILLVITVFLNFVVGRLPASVVRIDFTEHGEYTLSDATRSIFGRISDVVTLTYYVSVDLTGPMARVRQDTVDFLSEIRRLAPAGNLIVRVVDPEDEARERAAERERRKSEVRARAEAEGQQVEEEDDFHFDPFTGQMSQRKRTEYEKVLDEFARKGVRKLQQQQIRQDKLEIAAFYSAIMVSYAGKEDEVIPDHQSLENLEYELASRVLKLTLPDEDRAVVAVYNGQPRPAAPRPPDPRMPFMPPPGGDEEEYGILKHQALGDLFTVKTTKLTKDDPIPERTSTLIIAQPKELNDRQVYEINRFVSGGGRAVFLLGNYRVDMDTFQVTPVRSGLETLLAAWGVRLDARPFNSLQCGQIMIRRTVRTPLGDMQGDMPTPLSTHVLATPRNFDMDSPFLRNINVIVCPWGAALRVDSEDTLGEKGIDSAQILVTSSDDTWFGKTSAMNLNDLMDGGPRREEDLATFQGMGSFPLVALLRGRFAFEYEGRDVPDWPAEDDEDNDHPPGGAPPPVKASLPERRESNILVVGSPDFAKDVYIQRHDRRLYMGKYLFLRNVVEAFSLGDELLSIRAKQPSQRPLDPELSDGTRTFLKWFNVLLMPILAGAAGLVYAMVRRQTSSAYERRMAAQALAGMSPSRAAENQ